jgi:hypothetical protein
MSLNCGQQGTCCSSSQVMYDHGELWWNDMNRGKLVIRLPELFGNSSSKAGGTGKGNYEFCLTMYLAPQRIL